MKTILVTGGAGFAGSNLAINFKRDLDNARVIALDNLKRRGSELTLPRLRQNGIEFVHGDVRIKEDLLAVGKVDIIIDCSAEPSVLAGNDGSPDYVISTNLTGTINALELARLHNAAIVFLSTSRVYPVVPLNALAFDEAETRFELSSNQTTPGASKNGISEVFPLEGARSLYGASKLASELFVQEYISTYGLRGVINRCGVLTGPWQMGKIDQGVIVLWIARHFFEKPLSYIGFEGTGKQVRDMLHIDDLYNLLSLQVQAIESYQGDVFNVGGGREVSVSLQELTSLCEQIVGKKIKMSQVPENRANDLRMYLTDNKKVMTAHPWQPKKGVSEIIEEIYGWIKDNQSTLEPILAT